MSKFWPAAFANYKYFHYCTPTCVEVCLPSRNWLITVATAYHDKRNDILAVKMTKAHQILTKPSVGSDRGEPWDGMRWDEMWCGGVGCGVAEENTLTGPHERRAAARCLPPTPGHQGSCCSSGGGKGSVPRVDPNSSSLLTQTHTSMLKL